MRLRGLNKKLLFLELKAYFRKVFKCLY